MLLQDRRRWYCRGHITKLASLLYQAVEACEKFAPTECSKHSLAHMIHRSQPVAAFLRALLSVIIPRSWLCQFLTVIQRRCSLGDSMLALAEQAKRLRKVLGGGMRQAGIIAAAGLEAAINNFVRLREVKEHGANHWWSSLYERELNENLYDFCLDPFLSQVIHADMHGELLAIEMVDEAPAGLISPLGHCYRAAAHNYSSSPHTFMHDRLLNGAFISHGHQDHENAKILGEGLAMLPGIRAERLPNDTNAVYFQVRLG